MSIIIMVRHLLPVWPPCVVIMRLRTASPEAWFSPLTDKGGKKPLHVTLCKLQTGSGLLISSLKGDSLFLFSVCLSLPFNLAFYLSLTTPPTTFWTLPFLPFPHYLSSILISNISYQCTDSISASLPPFPLQTEATYAFLPEKEMLNPCRDMEKSEMKRSWALKFPYRPALTGAGLSEPVSRARGWAKLPFSVIRR